MNNAKEIKTSTQFKKTFSVAPMMAWTTRHCRVFHRKLTRQSLLYSEMITTGAICHHADDNASRFLYKSDLEGDVVLQLGGSNPDDLQRSVEIANNYNYAQYNLNVGCPSDRVQKGKIGAILMKEPELVAKCFKAMQRATDKSVTVKNRLAIDDFDEKTIFSFVETIANAGCKTFIIHARKAWLNGLNPKENRHKPPINYELVYEVKQKFPELEIIINGEISTIEQCQNHLQHVDGVMLGREAYHNPYLLTQVDAMLEEFNSNSEENTHKEAHNSGEIELYNQIYQQNHQPISRIEIIKSMLPYIENELEKGCMPKHITQHWLGLYHNVAGTKKFKRFISENMPQSKDMVALNKLIELLLI